MSFSCWAVGHAFGISCLARFAILVASPQTVQSYYDGTYKTQSCNILRNLKYERCFKAIFAVQPDWVLRVKSAIEKKGYSLGNWRLMVIEDTFKSQVLDAVSQVRSSERVAFREIDSLLVWVDDDIESNVID